MDAPARPGTDLARQIVVISSVVFMIIAAMVGTGLFGGTNVRDLQGGALDADSTVLAPATSAFSIWSLIYVLMIAYAIWQALPSQRGRERQRRAGWWIAATAVLNGGWLLAAQFLTLPATVVAIVALLAALGVTIRRLVHTPAETWADRLFMDGTVGIHLGWVSLATVANVTAWLAADVVPAMDADAQQLWGVIVLVVVALVGIAVAVGTGGRIAPALAMTWGLVWIGVARTSGEPHAPAVATAAFIVAAVILVTAVAATLRRRAVAATIGD
ncbi:tryptophan-rich sensory protein [Microbacterium sp. VKM Ac-2870]|uniref:tryptophan-rich sensory protein n=1 Tax=Microbacterium sp. VKM Ac-2870 TaxID=2783825 RepID=UPI00188B5C7A|nr:tryptophan-rich sensory protein [Microbacterium sp. VKM Ac-2870]MBF4561344.1 tryptophan-rich sensory protein [Microbacterium sp. VKM Ac-2870]